MALIQGAWAVTSVNGRMKAQCTVSNTGMLDAYTLKTPKVLDGSKPWTLFVTADEDLDASAVYVDVWGGYSDSFALASENPPTAVGTGCEIFATTTDIKAGINTFALRVIPGNVGVVAAVTTFPGAVAVIPPLPYYVINLDGADAIDDVAIITFTIIQ